MYRFIMRGAKMEPLRVSSASLPRPKTARLHKQERRRQTIESHVGMHWHQRPVTAGPHKRFTRKVQTRPATAAPERTVSVSDDESEDNADEEEAEVEESLQNPISLCSPQGANESQLLSLDLAHVLGNIYSKGGDVENEIMAILEGDGELSQHLQRMWGTQTVTEKEKEGFMKNGVLVSMKSDDIVRKAMAMVNQKSKESRDQHGDQQDEWDTILHAENNQAKFLVSANKMRINALNQKLALIERERTKDQMLRTRKRSIVQRVD